MLGTTRKTPKKRTDLVLLCRQGLSGIFLDESLSGNITLKFPMILVLLQLGMVCSRK